jgi:chromatin remodeling complex protein RSC6
MPFTIAKHPPHEGRLLFDLSSVATDKDNRAKRSSIPFPAQKKAEKEEGNDKDEKRDRGRDKERQERDKKRTKAKRVQGGREGRKR